MGMFKKGDWVRSKEVGATCGLVGVIIDDDMTSVPYLIRFNDFEDGHGKADNEWWLSGGEVEPWQPKVGERVRIKDATLFLTGTRTGDEATVIGFNDKQVEIELEHASAGTILQIAYVEHLEPIIDAAPATPVAAPLKIESGKFYKTRDGRKVGPIERSTEGFYSEEWKWSAPQIVSPFNDLGRWDALGQDSNNDLVSLWEEPAVAVAASNDNAAPTKPKFKVGDVVRGVINPIEYVILKVHADGKVDVRAKSSWCNYFEQRAEDFAPLAPAIVCLIENGQPKPADRPFVHPDQAAAERESRRLAGAHKGKEFGVYVLTSTAKEERTYDHEWQRLAVVGRKIEAIKELRSEHTFLSLRSAKDFVEDFLRAA